MSRTVWNFGGGPGVPGTRDASCSTAANRLPASERSGPRRLGRVRNCWVNSGVNCRAACLPEPRAIPVCVPAVQRVTNANCTSSIAQNVTFGVSTGPSILVRWRRQGVLSRRGAYSALLRYSTSSVTHRFYVTPAPGDGPMDQTRARERHARRGQTRHRRRRRRAPRHTTASPCCSGSLVASAPRARSLQPRPYVPHARTPPGARRPAAGH